MCHYDFLRKFSQGTRLKEEPSIEVDVRWQRRPLLSRDCVSIKDCPDRTTPVMPVTTTGQCCIYDKRIASITWAVCAMR